MRYLIISSLLFIWSNFTFAQFAIVSDKDGFVNIRGTKDFGDNVKEKLDNDQFVYILEAKDDWAYIFYMKNSQLVRNGFVYRDRLKVINDFSSIPLVSTKEQEVVFTKGETTLTVSAKKFYREEHDFTFYKENTEQIQYIDGLPYMGTDGEFPNSEYASIEVKIGSDQFTFPAEAIRNLYEVRLADTKVNYDSNNDTIYIQSMNSDGAGAYEVIWRVVKGVFKDRYIASGF